MIVGSRHVVDVRRRISYAIRVVAVVDLGRRRPVSMVVVIVMGRGRRGSSCSGVLLGVLLAGRRRLVVMLRGGVAIGGGRSRCGILGDIHVGAGRRVAWLRGGRGVGADFHVGVVCRWNEKLVGKLGVSLKKILVKLCRVI